MAKTVTSGESAEALFRKHPGWQPLLADLYRLLQKCSLGETVRWGVPTRMLQGSPVVSLVAFKAYAGSFFASDRIIESPGTTVAHRLRFCTCANSDKTGHRPALSGMEHFMFHGRLLCQKSAKSGPLEPGTISTAVCTGTGRARQTHRAERHQ